jgi:AcrR family transcriptional regulator
MNGYERRKHKKMENIYNISFKLFAQFGFQKVSVNEIAQMAKVSPATIYNYFGTKEQLYADMLMNWMDKQLELYEHTLDSRLTFPEKTKEIMLLEAKNLKILADEFTKVPSSESDGLAQQMERYNGKKVMPFFMKFVELGKQEGFIHPDQTDEMTIMYFTMYKNELSRYLAASNDYGTTIKMDQWMELFFYGLVRRTKHE